MEFRFLESVFEKCMAIELRNEGLTTSLQQPITVRCRDEVAGEFVAGIVVEDAVIVELKSVRRVVRAHKVQLVNYLVATL
jgi:GxxExxY protein